MISEWVSKLGTSLIDPEGRISALMNSLGGQRFFPSVEEDPDSVWITDPPGNNEPGYYVLKHMSIPFVIHSDDSSANVDFTYEKIRYSIRTARAASAQGNLRIISLMLQSLDQAVKHGLMRWQDAFLPFQQTSKGHEKTWWSILRLPPDATREEVKEAFHKLSRKHHPDRGGDEEMFKAINAAHQQARAELGIT